MNILSSEMFFCWPEVSSKSFPTTNLLESVHVAILIIHR